MRDKGTSAMKEADAMGFADSCQATWCYVQEDGILQGQGSQKAEEVRTGQRTSVTNTSKKLKHLNYSDFCFSEQTA